MWRLDSVEVDKEAMVRAKSGTKSVSRRGSGDSEVSGLSVRKRIGWLALAGTVVFTGTALLGFDSSDWPSHMVYPTNGTAANWCGAFGALVAYGIYYAFGPGVWVGVALAVGYLVLTALGRDVSHLGLRVAGSILIVLGFSSLLSLALPAFGAFPEGNGGLLAHAGTLALVERFNGFGTTLIVLVVLAVGAIVAVDELVVALPVLFLRSIGFLKKVLVGSASKTTAGALGRLAISISSRGRRSSELDSAVESVSATGRKVTVPVRLNGRSAADGAGDWIDPDAGGIGGVRSFNEEESEALATFGIGSKSKGGKKKRGGHSEADEDAGEINAVEVKSREIDVNALREKIARLPVNFASKKGVEQVGGTKGAGMAATEDDLPRSEDYTGYSFPNFELLEEPEFAFNARMEEFVRNQAESLETALQTYGIDGEVVGIDSGPVITLYEVQLAPGTKVSSIQTISSDIARSLRAQNIRIVANMAGKTTVGIEVPNLQKEKVRIKELMTSTRAAQKMRLPMFLGKDASGTPLIADLTSMPHMLIAGTTGSGKSVCMNTIIMSFLFTKRPDELKLILVDPKMVEMSQFRDIPHLMCPVVTEMSKAAAILEWAVTKMEERYELLAEIGVRDIASFNQLEWEEIKDRIGELSEEEEARFPKKLPYIVFMIDELADLIMMNKEVESSIVRIAQKARAVGIHLILATQRPQANVVTGLIKSNMPCRVSFKVSSGMDSRIVLDQKGAELLLGQGDMLFLSPRSSELIRAQGTLVDDVEIRQVVRFLKEIASPTFERQLVQLRSADSGEVGEESHLVDRERDPLFVEAVRIVVDSQRGSVSLLQRRLAIGYTRASRLIDQMGKAGIIGEHKGSVAREVLLSPEEWEQMRKMMDEEEAGGTLFDTSKESDSADEEEGDAIVAAHDDDCESEGEAEGEGIAVVRSGEGERALEEEEEDEEEVGEVADDDEGDEEADEEGYEYEVEYVDEAGHRIPADEVDDEEYEYVYEDGSEDEGKG